MKNILIGLSWPYANGELHIGHFASSLPADVLARYYRLKGNKVCFVSGTDCFGTPISIQSQKEKKSPTEIVELYHKKFIEVFEKAEFSFDIYSKTIEDSHQKFAYEFHKDLYNSEYIYKKNEKKLFCEHCNRFLPDRYVEGICPRCGKKSKGDSCENCGKVLEPEDLLLPKCILCGNKPDFKDNYQYNISLSKLEKELNNYFKKNSSDWTLNAINLTNRYFDEGLLDRAISRDLDWGIPIPVKNEDNKVIYNWGENVLGYLSTCKLWCEKNNINFDKFIKRDNSEHIFVHGKDNIPFHSIIYPALILASGRNYNLPNKIFAFEYVTNNGEKISKSKGTNLLIKDLIDKYNSDFVRYYFAKNISDRKDLDFSLQKFSECVNGELINNWGNFINRTFSFIKNKFDGKLEKFAIESNILEKINQTFIDVSNEFSNGKISNALKIIFELISFSNKFLQKTEPWSILKINKKEAENLCYQYIVLISNINILLSPFIPKCSNKISNWLNYNISDYSIYIPDRINIDSFNILWERII